MASVYGYDFIEVSSSPSISSSSTFNNDIKFQIEQPTSAYISGKNSYASIGLQIVMTRSDSTTHTLEPIINAGTRAVPTCISVPYICQNPGSAFFQNIACSVNNNELTNYQQAPQTSTLYRMLYESPNEEKSVNCTNGIIPMDSDDMSVAVGTIYNDYTSLAAKMGSGENALGGLFSKRMIWALKNQYNFDKSNTNKLNFQLPLPLFYTNDLIYVGSNGKINITFNVDPSWYKNLIQIAGSNATVLGDAYSLTTLASGFAANTINVSITDFKLYIARAHVLSVPRSLKLTYHLKQFSTFYAPLTAGTNNNFNFTFKENRRISHIVVAFVNATGLSFKYSPSDFSSSYTILNNLETRITGDGMTNIKKIMLNFGGNIYPYTPYNLENVTAGITNTNDLSRAYYDMIVGTDSIRDRVGSLLNFSQWLVQKIFVFKSRQPIDNVSNACTITCEVGQNTSMTNIFVLGLYDEFMSIGLGPNAEYTSYEVSAAPPQ